MRPSLLCGAATAAAVVIFTGMVSAQDADVSRGKKVFAEQKCSLCHSIEGKPNAKGPLDDIGSKYTAEEIRQWIVEPVAMAMKHKATRKPSMPSKYTSLPKGDLDALVAYVASLKKK